eukprot:11466944-Ditylum_brightwellii.AAC.1
MKARKAQVKLPCAKATPRVGRKLGKNANAGGRKKDNNIDESDSSIEEVTPKPTPSKKKKTTTSKKVPKNRKCSDKSDLSTSGILWSFGKSGLSPTLPRKVREDSSAGGLDVSSTS